MEEKLTERTGSNCILGVAEGLASASENEKGESLSRDSRLLREDSNRLRGES